MAPIPPSPPSEPSTLPDNELGHRRQVQQFATDIADMFKEIGAHMVELRELGVPTVEWVDLMMRHSSDKTQEQFRDNDGSLAAVFDMAAAFLDSGEIPSNEEVVPVALKLGSTMKGGNMLGVLASALPLVLKFFGKSSSAPPGPIAMSADEYQERMEEMKERMLESFTPETLRMRNVITRLFADAIKMTDASGKPVEGQAPALECFVTLKAGVQANGSLSVTPEGGLRLLAPNEIPSGQRGVAGKMVLIEHFFDYDQVADIAVMREVKASEPSRIVTSS